MSYMMYPNSDRFHSDSRVPFYPPYNEDKPDFTAVSDGRILRKKVYTSLPPNIGVAIYDRRPNTVKHIYTDGRAHFFPQMKSLKPVNTMYGSETVLRHQTNPEKPLGYNRQLYPFNTRDIREPRLYGKELPSFFR